MSTNNSSNIMRDGQPMVTVLTQTSGLETTRERRKRRSDLEIFSEILQIAMSGAKKTRIVYGANLNSRIVNKYIESLQKAGFLSSPEKTGSVYRTTEDGRNYIRYMQSLKKSLTVPEEEC